MFKKALIVFVLLLLAAGVFSARLVDPISKDLAPQDNFVGTVAPGNTIELIFSKELTDKYEAITVLTPLPNGFSTDIKYEKESIKLFVSVPKDAPVGDYPLSIRLYGSTRDDTFGIYLTVVSGSLDVSPSSAAQVNVPVGSPAEYKFFFKNGTDASANFYINNTLPPNWNQDNLFAVQPAPIVVSVPKRSQLEQSIFIYPRQQGKKDFGVTVSFENTQKDFSFAVGGIPSLKSKLSAMSLGLPFYSFSMLPAYFLDGIASFWMK